MQEWKFNFGDITFRGKRWGHLGGTPVIALHGWLDNCASFDFLAPLLENVDLVALDLAGQGKSDHRYHSGAYNIWLDIMEVMAVADQLGWKQFGLVGHSRGAMISTLIAGTFPERITHLAVIEAFVPQVIKAEEAPEQMAAAINGLVGLRNHKATAFSSFEEAVKAREKGMLRLNHVDATALAKRGVKEERGKFYWSNDLKLKVPSEVKFTLGQVQAFVDRLPVTVQLILAEDGLVHDFPELREFFEHTPDLQITRLAGDHHLHMSQHCQQVADVFNAYFSGS